MRVALVTARLLLTITSIGCGGVRPGDGAGSRIEVKQRLVSGASLKQFQASEQATTFTEFEWKFGDDHSTWPQITGSLDESWKGRGVRLRKVDSQLALEGNVDFSSRDVDEIEVEVARKALGAAVLYWMAPGQPFSTECRLRLSGAESASSTVRFVVRGHPCWEGKVGKLRLVLGVNEEHLRVLSVRGLRSRYPKDRLLELDGSEWRLDLAGELHDARLAAVGRDWRIGLTLPRGGRLAFAFSTGRSPGGAVDASVTFVQTGQEEVELYRAAGDSPGSVVAWREATIDLGALGGRQGELVFRFAAPESELAFTAVPAWGDVRILGPATRATPDLFLISVDTLRGDRLSLAGYGRRTTARIDEWAMRNAVIFSHAVASSPWTLPSHVSMFTGQDCLSHGVNVDLRVPEGLVPLAERLRSSGYRTIAVTGGGYLHPRYGLDRGFDQFIYWDRGQGSESELVSNLERALSVLKASEGEKVFLFFHTYEVHTPYHARQPYFDNFGGASAPVEKRTIAVAREPSTAANGYLTRSAFQGSGDSDVEAEEVARIPGLLYDSGVAYADSKIGDLLSEIEKRASAASALTVLTSDHGEALGEHGLAFHAYPYEDNLHVPLLVSFPDRRGAGTRRDEVVGLIDVAPTILAAARVDPIAADGVDLGTLRAGVTRWLWSYAASSNWGIALRTGVDRKFLFNDSAWKPLRGKASYFDLAADPGESRDLGIASAPARDLGRMVRRRLAESLGGLFVDLSNTGGATLRADFFSSSFQPERIKLPLVTGDPEILWRDGGIVRVELEPGEQARLVVHSRELSTLRVNIDEELVRELPAATIRRGVAFRRSSGGWSLAPIGGQKTDLTIGFRGDSSTGAGPDAVDRSLEAQLRELGYV